MTKKWFLVVAGVFGLTVVVPTSAGAATAEVSIVDFAFQPFTVNINVGDEVRWTNQGPSQHTVSTFNPGQPPFDSPVLNPGQTYRVTFNTAGSFSYFCNIHPFMQGVVNVEGGTTSSTTTTAPVASTTINPTSIEPGDSFTASATGVSSPNSSYVLRMGTTAANCPNGLALGGARNSDASGNITPTQRVMPTNTTSGTRWLCWVRTGNPSDRSPPRQVTVV